MAKNWQIELGKQIKAARDLRHVTQQELATAVKVKRGSIYLYETGKGNPQFSAVAAMALFLKTEFNVLGCRIGPADARASKQLEEKRQLELALDHDHSFLANVKIRPTSQSITITAHAEYGIKSA